MQMVMLQILIMKEASKTAEAFDGGSAKGYNLEIGSGTFIDGFESGLIGKVKVGETVDRTWTFPEDYGSEDLAGKDVVFKVTINSIQDESYPTYDTLTDEYVEAQLQRLLRSIYS